MNKEELTYYKNKLNQEKKRITDLINQLDDNGVTRFNAEVASELSFYDNHPSDIASETFEVEKGRALEANERALLDKIDDAVRAIDEGSYGKCQKCGKEIDKERLDFLPYALNCIECEDVVSTIKTYNSNQRVVEESVIGNPFGHKSRYGDKDKIGFDEEDSYQSVGRFNEIRNEPQYEYDYDDENYVEEIEKISNEQYKNQLPD
ncbi:TraR/DksA C4-type zinc finger protein [Clostridium tertium]|jgi:YteA family regulatory protein|uniref:TraR/DksA C4-type zinc finger protein n=1 Tax=Clostridium tertium TaxID=1559 RepID=A0A9X3XR01_9CLOT|nr:MULTISPECIES: TraR/DksA C4-type zinc finger protein [Clostridium]EEH98459.1 yteA family sporulation protein [Clostridium sp. 7_2_43FAA]MDB1948297.1 TraR/DksA C4-type zinc finger protein [Clostridium tertium]MDB1954202.1 TraR/DksA C4-type zinc finger protein [Clostridium tertium]MDB1957839.1 TraR/DksA C4-type zinc finger protein [Clostridium tertium]MDB1961709.1 TraR/DksA C4-type zinc finger protein [Clostridium tertium]